MAAPRQQRFWEYVSSLGHEVTLLALKMDRYNVVDIERNLFSVKAVDMIGVGRRVRGFLDVIENAKPDWVYLNDESDGGQILQACQLKTTAPFRLALFSWENKPNPYMWEKFIDKIDLFIPGCPGARKILLSKGVPLEKIMAEDIIQVGVDAELFTPMPENPKQFDTITCSGFTDNKGVCEIQQVVKDLGLRHLWVGAKRSYDQLSCEITYGPKGWVNYEELPYFYNRARLHVLFSHDTPTWTEQFAPYSTVEALSCGLTAVTSDAGEIPHFLKDCPGVKIVPQNDLAALRSGLEKMLNYAGETGRRFVVENFGYEKIAEKLVKAFESN
jgi:glycosyltransferase involved in cell wall biosynthesis